MLIMFADSEGLKVYILSPACKSELFLKQQSSQNNRLIIIGATADLHVFAEIISLSIRCLRTYESKHLPTIDMN